MQRLVGATLCVLLASPLPAWSQRLDTWNSQTREKSQMLKSAALTALSQSQNEQALSLLMRATEADPKNPHVLNTLAIALARQERYEEALDALRKSFKLDSKLSETLLTTGFVYFLQHDWDAAIGAWTKLAAQDSKLPQVHSLIGYANLRKGDFVAADEAFHKTIAQKPNSHLAYHGIALEKYLAGDVALSIQAAEQAEAIDPYHLVVALRAANDLATGSHSSAKTHVKNWTMQTKKGKPAHSMTHLGYSIQHDFYWDPLSTDETAGADVLQAALAPLPGPNKKTPPPLKKVAPLLAKAQAKAEADRSDFYCRHQLGLVQLAAGDYPAAAAQFSAALKLCPAAVIDWLYLARANALAGKSAEAASAANQFKRLKPTTKVAADVEALACNSASPASEPAVDVAAKRPAAQKNQPIPNARPVKKEPDSALSKSSAASNSSPSATTANSTPEQPSTNPTSAGASPVITPGETPVKPPESTSSPVPSAFAYPSAASTPASTGSSPSAAVPTMTTPSPVADNVLPTTVPATTTGPAAGGAISSPTDSAAASPAAGNAPPLPTDSATATNSVAGNTTPPLLPTDSATAASPLVGNAIAPPLPTDSATTTGPASGHTAPLPPTDSAAASPAAGNAPPLPTDSATTTSPVAGSSQAETAQIAQALPLPTLPASSPANDSSSIAGTTASTSGASSTNSSPEPRVAQVPIGRIKGLKAMPVPATAAMASPLKPTKAPAPITKVAATGDNFISATETSLGPCVWKKFPITVFIDAAPGANGARLQSEVKDAFETWTKATGNKLRFEIVSARKADIVVTWVNSVKALKSTSEAGEASVNYGTSGKAKRTLSDPGEIKNATIKLLTKDIFNNEWLPGDLRLVALHEIAHSLGIFGHSQNPGDIMYTKKGASELSPRDINTVNMLYASVSCQ